MIHFKSAKKLSNKLKICYEGDDNIKKGKMETYRGQFEFLEMEEDESIVSYFLHVDSIFNSIIGIRERIKEANIVCKILIALPSRFNPKASFLEQIFGIQKLNMDSFYVTLTTYEIKTEKEKTQKSHSMQPIK